MMDTPTDDYLQQFRTQSDEAFLAMQTTADNAMSQFLQSYGEGTQMTSFRTPDFAWGRSSTIGLSATASTSTRNKAREAADRGGQAQRRDSAKAKSGPKDPHAVFNDFGDLGADIKREFAEHTHQAAEEGKGFLRSLTMDLGQRAKKEATALAEAARRAMQEETSLRGLKERAQAELQAAKQRVAAELTDARSDALQDLEGMAVDKLGVLHQEGMEAAESAGRTAQKKLDDILLGGPPVD